MSGRQLFAPETSIQQENGWGGRPRPCARGADPQGGRGGTPECPEEGICRRAAAGGQLIWPNRAVSVCIDWIDENSMAKPLST